MRARGLTITLGLAVLGLSACTSPQQQAQNRQAHSATQFLELVGSIGDPGRVAATDFAFAKMAREEGNWTAFRAYAAPDAVMDGGDSWAPASQILANLADPPEAIAWGPTDVWSSCDGTLAATLGRFRRPNGVVGDYVSVWELQPDNSYKWIYDTGVPDDPQPEPEPESDIPEGAIVVPGLTAIRGRVADCPPKGETTRRLPTLLLAADMRHGSYTADDQSLRATRLLAADGSREVIVEWFREGEWTVATRLAIPAEVAE